MEWDLWFSFPFFFIVNFSFWSRYWEGVLKAATLLGPGGSILGLEPVKSELRGGGGGKERFSDSREIPEWPPSGLCLLRDGVGGGGKSRVSVWLSLLTTR